MNRPTLQMEDVSIQRVDSLMAYLGTMKVPSPANPDLTLLDMYGDTLNHLKYSIKVWADQQWAEVAYLGGRITVMPCYWCGGSGNELLSMYRKCPKCEGLGYTIEKEERK